MRDTEDLHTLQSPAEIRATKKKDAAAEREAAAEKAKKKATRKARRVARLGALKKAGYKPNRKFTKDKKTGKDLKGYFAEGSTIKSASWAG